MKTNNFPVLVFLTVSFALCIASCSDSQEKPAEEKTTTAANPDDIVKHGEYLVTIMGCNDCHSPKKMGARGPELIPDLLLSGFPSNRPIVKFDSKMIREGFAMFYPDLTASAGPWGVSFAANLTPDSTGTGSWTEEQFKKAMTQGKFKGLDSGRMLLPPMPWFNFSKLKDEDLHAIFMYLKSIPPVKNVVPAALTPNNM